MFDYSELLALMFKKSVTRRKLAQVCGISENSMQSKLRNETPFKQAEIIQIASFFSIPASDIGKYFFSAKS